MRRKQIEKAEQELLVRWFKLQYPTSLLFAIPNGGSRHIVEAKSLVLSGVKAGIPDLMLAEGVNGFNGLFIELKRPKVKGTSNPVVSKEQKAVITHLIAKGYAAHVCYGFEEAKNIIVNYLSERELGI